MGATPRSAIRLHFFTDPAAFLAVAGNHLAADPVISTVVTTTAHRSAAQLAEGIPQPDRDWWLAVRDESGAVRGAGMRTAPFAPYPLFLLPMPDEAAVALAQLTTDVFSKREKLASLLLFVVAACHYGYDPLAHFFGGTGYAARNLFYILRGLEGVILFTVIGSLVRHPAVWVVCLWGLVEEGQTATCRIAKGIGEKNNSYEQFSGLCGAEMYWLGLFAALVIGAYILDRGKSHELDG